MSSEEKKLFKTLEILLTYSVCSYVVLIFVSKGEGLRNILLFGSLFLWILTIKRGEIANFFRSPLTFLYILFVSFCFISVLYSLDPVYSIDAMREDFIKGVILFPIIATTFNSEEKLKKISSAFALSALILVANGYVSYLTGGVTVFKPDTKIVHLWHNQFARHLNSLLPFIFSLLFFSKRRAARILLFCLLLFSVLGLIFSTSRGGYVSFISMMVVWVLFLTKERQVHLKKVIAVVSLIAMLAVVFSFTSVPYIRDRITTFESIILRFHVWIPVIEAIKERPVFGWGFGPKMIRKEEPYLNTPHKPPQRGVHNTFLKIAFTTGVVGLTSYLSLLIYAILFCLRNARKEGARNFGSFMFVSVLSVIIGNYFFHSMIELVSFLSLSILLGIALASEKRNRN
ncbi:MAG: O-antigen ligase family protein [Nitrospirota bacterium]